VAFKSNGKIKNLTGELFLGNSNNPKPLEFSKSKKARASGERSERDEQQIFFSFPMIGFVSIRGVKRLRSKLSRNAALYRYN
jgi:hypothetical protein